MPVFEVLSKVKPTENNRDWDPAFAGAYVHVFTGAGDIHQALNKAEEHYKEYDLEVVWITSINEITIDSIEDEEIEEGFPTADDYKKIESEKGFWIGPYFLYEDEE